MARAIPKNNCIDWYGEHDRSIWNDGAGALEHGAFGVPEGSQGSRQDLEATAAGFNQCLMHPPGPPLELRPPLASLEPEPPPPPKKPIVMTTATTATGLIRQGADVYRRNRFEIDTG